MRTIDDFRLIWSILLPLALSTLRPSSRAIPDLPTRQKRILIVGRQLTPWDHNYATKIPLGRLSSANLCREVADSLRILMEFGLSTMFLYGEERVQYGHVLGSIQTNTNWVWRNEPEP